MLLYLDLNCFNRPFDDQSQARVAKETRAVFSVLERLENGTDQLTWSAALTFENAQHPLEDRRDEIARWKQRAISNFGITGAVAKRAQELVDAGFRALDSAHLACAETARCDHFLTCDDRLLRRAAKVQLMVVVQNPIDYIEEQSDE
jgi:predicted nucleic acid-binding protein